MKEKLLLAAVVGLGVAAVALTGLAQVAPPLPRQPGAPAGSDLPPSCDTLPSVPSLRLLPQGTSPTSAYERFQAEETGLARQVEELVHRLARAKDDDGKEKLKDKLTETLQKQFDLRQKRQQKEIEALEEQVKNLKEVLQKRQENRREIVKQRLDQLVREAMGLGW
jgi:hypothetical protein